MIRLFVFLCLCAGLFWLYPAVGSGPAPALALDGPFGAAPEGNQPAGKPGISDSARQASESTRPVFAAPGWYARFMQTISGVQKKFRSSMASQAGEIRRNPLGPALWTFLMLAFAYGVVHAVGPGHGKGFAVAYFASRRARMWQAAFLGGLMPVFHVLSAVLLVLGLYLLFDSIGFGQVEARGRILQRVSYGLLVIIGLILALRALRHMMRGEDGEHEHGRADTRSMMGLALAAGLFPCPATAIILLFSISLDILWAGLAAALSVALGMALTVSFFSAATILSRNSLEVFIARWEKPMKIVRRTAALGGGLFISLAGMALYLSTI